MKVVEWLRRQDVRLDVQIHAEMDPVADSPPRWRCDIRGFLVPRHNRPAVFITNRVGRVINEVTAFGDSPDEAYRSAVGHLVGLRVNVILRERDDTLTFPANLTE